jgi:hypothetical protein
MTNVIHPAKTVAQKIIIDDETMEKLQKACDDHDIAKESMGTAAARFYNLGFRAEHLKQSGGDKEMINIADNAIARTMPEMARKLFSMKPVDLNETDKAIRSAFMKNLADKRGALAKALAKCAEKVKAEASGDTPPELSEVIAGKIKEIIESIQKAGVPDAKTGKHKLQGVDITALVKHLNAAVEELT